MFFPSGIELSQPGEAAGDQRKHAGGHGVERAQMADGAFVENTARAIDDVVRGQSSGFIDDEDAIHEGFG